MKAKLTFEKVVGDDMRAVQMNGVTIGRIYRVQTTSGSGWTHQIGCGYYRETMKDAAQPLVKQALAGARFVQGVRA